MEDPDACSRCWDRAALPAWGTAAVAQFVVAIEQPGPWGRKPLTESELDPTIGAALDSATSAAGGKAVLIRRPGRAGEGPRRAYVAGRDWLLRREIGDPGELPTLPWHDAEALRALGFEPTEPVLLVCTNGKRDVCCSLRGRPVAAAAEAGHTGRVFEATHLNGHRFAPTALLLPSLLVLARLDDRVADAVLSAAGVGELAPAVLGPAHYRGLSWLPQPAQAAEAVVRAELGERDPMALSVEERADHPGRYTVTRRDGRRYDVAVTRTDVGEQVLSCGKAPEPHSIFAPEIVGPATSSRSGATA